jgi:DNA adenine methylase
MARRDHPETRVRPPLKWAGSKFKILDDIRRHLPPGNRLIEPFVGSAVVFLNTNYPEYILNDINKDLISFYRILQTDGEAFIEYARKFFVAKNNAERAYYRLRDTFNTTDDQPLKAALFLYINKFGFNGLCRYNSKGESNVPFGSYNEPYFPETEIRRFLEHAKHAQFTCSDFETIMRSAVRGDVVYCDPPYVPLSDTANFTAYSAGGFNASSQVRLAELAEELSEKGITVVVSNHYTRFTKEIYARAKKYRLDVRRTISRDGAKRELASEVLAVFKAKGGQG